MSRSLKKSINGLQKILRTFDRIMQRLPSTYPRAHLVVHRSRESLASYFFAHEPDDSGDVWDVKAFCDLPSNTVHMGMDAQKETCRTLSSWILHEMGHIYAYHKYGEDSERYEDETYANRFASRWMRRLDKEGWF